MLLLPRTSKKSWPKSRIFRNFSISKFLEISIENCMKTKLFEINIFRKFSISKFRKFLISKFFVFIQFSMKICENFEIEKIRKFLLLDQLFFEVRRSNSIELILLIRIFPSDQKHSIRNCMKFAHVIFLVLNVNSREEKKYSYML